MVLLDKVDQVSIIILVDNYTGLEIKYDNNSKISKFLFDAGVSPEGLLFNAKILGVNIADIDSIILVTDRLITTWV